MTIIPYFMVYQILFYKDYSRYKILKLVWWPGHKKHDHITPILSELHWLPVQQCILYQVFMIVFKALHDLAPIYVTDMIV